MLFAKFIALASSLVVVAAQETNQTMSAIAVIRPDSPIKTLGNDTTGSANATAAANATDTASTTASASDSGSSSSAASPSASGTATAPLIAVPSGVIHIGQQPGGNGSVFIVGNITGLTPNSQVSLSIHQYGDLSNGCNSTGPVFNPLFAGMNNATNATSQVSRDTTDSSSWSDSATASDSASGWATASDSAAPSSTPSAGVGGGAGAGAGGNGSGPNAGNVGDLGTLFVDANGTALINLTDTSITLSGPYSVLGRAFAVSLVPQSNGANSTNSTGAGTNDTTSTGANGTVSTVPVAPASPLACGIIGVAA